MVEQARLVRGRRGVCGLCLKRDSPGTVDQAARSLKIASSVGLERRRKGVFSLQGLIHACAADAIPLSASGVGNFSLAKAIAMSPSQPSPANFSFKSGTYSTETRRSLRNPTQASASNSRNSPLPLAPLCEPESDSANPWRTRSKPCSRVAKPIQNHQPVHAKLPNQPDGGYAPPNPAPLAAAGVRGGTKKSLLPAGA
jgi:hypothetical protein